MLEMCDEVDILTTCDYEWCEAILATKGWKEKKDKLDIIQKQSDTMKLAKGDYSELTKTLKKLVADSN
jgi:cytoskeleton-associated protein 5